MQKQKSKLEDTEKLVGDNAKTVISAGLLTSAIPIATAWI